MISDDKIKVGTVFVDAGIVMLGDPCYVLGDDASNRQRSWAQVCEQIDGSTNRKHEAGVWEPFGGGVGLICSSGYGDGAYPVYITLTDDGRPASLTVVFDDPDEASVQRDMVKAFNADEPHADVGEIGP